MTSINYNFPHSQRYQDSSTFSPSPSPSSSYSSRDERINNVVKRPLSESETENDSVKRQHKCRIIKLTNESYVMGHLDEEQTGIGAEVINGKDTFYGKFNKGRKVEGREDFPNGSYRFMGTYFPNGSKKEGIVTDILTGDVLFMGFIWNEELEVTGERLKLDQQGNPEMIMCGEWNQRGQFTGKIDMVSAIRSMGLSRERVDSMISSSPSPSRGDAPGLTSEMQSSSPPAHPTVSEQVDPEQRKTLETALALSNLHASKIELRLPLPVRTSAPQFTTSQSSQLVTSSVPHSSSRVLSKKAIYKKYTIGRSFLEYYFPKHKFGYGEGAPMGPDSLPDSLFEFLKELDETEEGKKKMEDFLVIRKPLMIDGNEFNSLSIAQLFKEIFPERDDDGEIITFKHFVPWRLIEKSFDKSEWIVVKIPTAEDYYENLPDSTNKMAQDAETFGLAFRMPKMMEALFTALIHSAITKQALFPDDLSVTSCEETVLLGSSKTRLFFGGSLEEGLFVNKRMKHQKLGILATASFESSEL